MAMAATSENSKATEPNSPDSRESQQKFELQNIESQLANESSNYVVHVQYIRVLRKMGEIEKLRQAREAMNENFSLTPVMWQEWARDEASISTGPEAFLGIEKIYERGVSDYLSVSLWCDYLRFVQEYDPSVREFSPDGIAKARNLFELAIAAAGLHVAEGSKIWEAYRELEQAILHTIDETNIKEKEKQVQRIRKIFHCQLSVPLASLRSTLVAYKSWEVELGPALDVESGDLDGIPSTVASAYQKALEMYNARADFEEQISKQDISDSEKFQQFAIYLKFEQSYGDLARVQLLYERAITEFPVSSDLWLDYTRYLDKTLKVGNIVRYVHSRARKNCPWVGDLWVRSLLALERCRVPEKEISTVFEKSLLCTFWTIEEYLNLFLTRVDGLRRRILLPGAEEDALNFSLIRETFQRASDYLSQQMKNTDGLLHLYAYWARLELNLGKDQAAARGVWESLVKICGSMLEAWQGYIGMEIELGHLDEARSIYRRCYSERFSGTGSDDICHNWLRFEREYGTLTDFDHAAQQVTTCLEELQLFRLQQEAKYVPELIDQKEKSYKQSVNGNSKTDSNMTDEESPAKRQKNTAQNLKKVHGKEKGRAQNLAEEKEVEEAKSKFEEHPNDQHIEDSSTGRAKVNIDKFIAVVVNLDFRATSEDLKKFFSDVGGVESVRILVDQYSGKSMGLAYVHFADDAHLAAALGKNKQMFFGRKISIAGGKRKRRDSAGHWASGEHTVPGQKYSEIIFPILSPDLVTNKDIHMQSSNQNFMESRAPHSVANKRGDNIQLKGRNTFAMPRNVRALGVPSINPKPAEVEDEKLQSNNEFKEMFLEFKGLHLHIFHPICGEDILNALPQGSEKF